MSLGLAGAHDGPAPLLLVETLLGSRDVTEECIHRHRSAVAAEPLLTCE